MQKRRFAFRFLFPLILILWLFGPTNWLYRDLPLSSVSAASLAARIEPQLTGHDLYLKAILTDRNMDQSELTYQWCISYDHGQSYQPLPGENASVLHLNRTNMPENVAYSCNITEKYITSNQLIWSAYYYLLHRDIRDGNVTNGAWYYELYNHILVTPSSMWGEQLTQNYPAVNEAAQIVYLMIFSCEWLGDHSFQPNASSYSAAPNERTVSTPKQMIFDCYRFLLGRAPSDAEVSFWYNALYRTNQPINGTCVRSDLHAYHANQNMPLTAYASMLQIINALADSDECKRHMSEAYDYNPQTGRFTYSQIDISYRKKEFHTIAFSGIIPPSYYLRNHTVQYILQNVDGTFPSEASGTISSEWYPISAKHILDWNGLPANLKEIYDYRFSCSLQDVQAGILYPSHECVITQNQTDTLYFYRKILSFQCIDIALPNQNQLGIAGPIKQIRYGMFIAGSLWGNDTRENAYYNGYHYSSCSSIQQATSSGTVYRYFSPNEYTVSLELNGGTIASNLGNPFRVACLASFYLPHPVRPGFTFLGWSISGAEKTLSDPCLEQSFTQLRSTSGNVTFTAIWRDDTSPTLSLDYYYEDGRPYPVGTWTNRNILVTARASDSGTGIASIQWDNQSPDTNISGGKSEKWFRESGKFSGYVTVTDRSNIANPHAGSAWIAAGQANTVKQAYGTICIDQYAPVIIDQTRELGSFQSFGGTKFTSIASQVYSWTNHAVTLSFSATDPQASSGLRSFTLWQTSPDFTARSQVYASQTNFPGYDSSDSLSYTVSEEGITYWLAQCEDNAGNSSELRITVRIDYQKPLLTATLTALSEENTTSNLDILDGIIALDQDQFSSGSPLRLTLHVTEPDSVQNGLISPDAYSGLKFLNYKITNHDNGLEYIGTKAFTYAQRCKDAETIIDLHNDSAPVANLFSGSFSIYAETGDYAGNGASDYGDLAEYRLQVSANSKFYSTSTQPSAPSSSRDQNLVTEENHTIIDPGYLRCGEDFLLHIKTAGYVDAITIDFPTSCIADGKPQAFTWIGSDTKKAEEFLHYVLLQNGSEEIRMVKSKQEAPCYQTFQYAQGIGVDSGNRSTDFECIIPQNTPEGTNYCITITAYKRNQNGDAPILINENGHISNPDQLLILQRKIWFKIKGNVFDSLRTTLPSKATTR